MESKKIVDCYKGKKVFITGHTGFKGAWLLQWLQLLGAEIKGYALPPANEDDLYNLIEGDTLCESVIADLLEKETLEDAILRFQPDFIFHLAAQPLVRASYEIPSDTFAVNTLGTAYLLDAVKKLQNKCVVVLITTDKVYENNEWVFAYREEDRLGGADPYSASKACAELVISAYRKSFFNDSSYGIHQKAIASTRAGNVIGGGDWSRERIVPDIVRSLLADQAVNIRNPAAIRPWQHVLEPLRGYLLLGAHLADDPLSFTGAWNFGPSLEGNKSVLELVKMALAVWGSGNYVISGNKNQPHEAGLLKLDICKSSSLLGWNPKFMVLEAVEYTIDWYKKFAFEKESIKAFTISQVQQYAEPTKKKNKLEGVAVGEM